MAQWSPVMRWERCQAPFRGEKRARHRVRVLSKARRIGPEQTRTRGNMAPHRACLNIVPEPAHRQLTTPSKRTRAGASFGACLALFFVRRKRCLATLGKADEGIKPGGRPPACHRRGRSRPRFPRATAPMMRRWVAKGGPGGRCQKKGGTRRGCHPSCIGLVSATNYSVYDVLNSMPSRDLGS